LRYQLSSKRRPQRLLLGGIGAAGLASMLAAMSCSSSEASSSDTGDGTGGAAPGVNPGFVVGASDLPGESSPAPGAVDSGGCLGETRQAEAIGLDMFVMLDLSGSMLDLLPAAPGPTSKWDAVRGSLESFVGAPETSGIGIGLQYFPQANAGVPFACTSNADCGSGPCTSSLCVTRGQVNDPEGGVPLEFWRPADAGGTLCLTDADCDASGGSCQTLHGACVLPAGASSANPSAHFANVSATPTTSIVPALCESQQDCGGVPDSRCEAVGLCSLAPVQCTASVGCRPGAGECLSFPYTCADYTSCDVARYGTPAIAISAATSHAADVIASLRAQVPVGATPTGPALSGALDHARAWAEQHPGRQVVTVLATDGFPTVCEPLEIPDIALLASTAASGPRPVRTFVIGVFGDADLGADGQARLDEIARAGGSERAIVVNTAGDVTRDFLDALNGIRSTAVSCDFQLDAAPGLDFDHVNLQVTDAEGERIELLSVSDRTACGDADGWYYVRDSAGVPLQLSVCPATCEQLERERARVDLQIGCVTRIR
jgi:hypothetical protein